ncbi:MAG: flagellar biosynthesis anti-sigma factor FlgM [Acidobacteria bacterium]|nr:flagellar biosynthesis anti-sigma factor FlgM [Acidobacteriota bacterium]
MKVGQRQSAGSSARVRDAAPAIAPGAAGSIRTVESADTAELSGLRGLVARALSSEPAARAGTVERLTVQVHDGSYQVDPAELSRAMVAELLGR